MNTIEKIEKKLRLDVPLRLKGILKKREESLEEFLIKFFQDFNNKNNTIYANNRRVQTDTGRRRSFGDIFRICRYYYPNCTIEEVKTLLYETLPDKVERFRSSYCTTINKRVFYVGDEDQESEFYDMDDEDEFGLTGEDWEQL